MSELLREIEGTWEEVAAQGAQFAGKRVRLILLDTSAPEDQVSVPPRPEPTAEQARLGILPAAIGNGAGAEIIHFADARSPLTEKEYLEFERAIAENRAMRRQLAQEQNQ